MIKIAIRLDDITEHMDWKKFLRFKELLDAYGVKPLIGVVPQNEDPMLEIDATPKLPASSEGFDKYISMLVQNGWMVAMHGITHIYTTKKGGLFPLNRDSELAGLPYEEQYELLSYAKELLLQRGIDTNIFMAPSHSYDYNTLRALKELDFQSITDGFGYSPYEYMDMNFYPISFRRSSTLKKHEGYSTFVYHTNTMKESDFEAFRLLLEGSGKASYEIVSYSDYLEAYSKKRGLAGRIREYLLAQFKHYMIKI